MYNLKNIRDKNLACHLFVENSIKLLNAFQFSCHKLVISVPNQNLSKTCYFEKSCKFSSASIRRCIG